MGPIWLPVLGLSGLLGLAVLMVPASHRFNIPYTVLLAVIGCLLGTLSEWGISLEHIDLVRDFFISLNSFSISSEAVLFIFLPVLVFEAALGIDAHRLADDVSSILLLAVIGLLISTFMVGHVLHWVSGIPIIVCLLLGAIVSATDPIAVMAIFKELQAPKRLSVLVEGESLFNDATAIVLFGILATMLVENSSVDFISGSKSFLKTFLLGIIVGATMGYGFCSVLSRLRKYPLAQITLTLSLAYASFIVAEHYLHVSGVMAVVSAALIVGSFGHASLSSETRIKLHETWDHFAFWANSVIFVLVGVIVPKTMGSISLNEWYLLGVLVLVAFGARALILFGVLPLFERWHSTTKTNNAFKGVMLWGGLRGAVSLALALSIMENPLFDPETQRFIGMQVTGFVLFTLLVNATTIGALLKFFKLDKLNPVDQIIRSRALKHSLVKIQSLLESKANNYNFEPGLSGGILKQFKEDENKVDVLLSRTNELSKNDWVRVGLYDLCTLEKEGYLEQFEEGQISLYNVRRLLVQVEDMKDCLQSESVVGGYEKYSEKILEFNWRFQFALALHRKFGVSGKVSAYLADRFEILLSCQAVMKENLLTALPKMKPLVGDSAEKVIRALIQDRLERGEQALQMLRLQYPEYYLMLQKRYLSHVAIRLQETDYEQFLKNSIISREVFKDLESELSAHKMLPRPALDLNLEPEKLVQRVPLFSGLSVDRIKYLSRLLKPLLTVPGEVIIRQGEIGHGMYFISSGCVEVEVLSTPIQLGTGEFFGEIALIKKRTRTFTVKSLGFCDLLVLSDSDFNLFLNDYPEVRHTLFETADKRIEMDGLK